MDSLSPLSSSKDRLPSLSETVGKAVPKIIKDDQYYFTFVIFKVDDCLFRVPKHELEDQSHVFRDMFSMPSAKDSGDVEGTSDDNPICLDSVSREEFKLLLRMLYPLKANDISVTLSVEQCTMLLKISRMWEFERINGIVKTRIREVLWDKISAVDKIKLAHDFQLEEWYEDAYYELATRNESLSVEEAQQLGLEFSIVMAQARERIRTSRLSASQVIRGVIGKLFCLPHHSEPYLEYGEVEKSYESP
ncbi:uncharacterized protein FOMMEDRAFT_156407 [Fomitiporia mediterranea MF3/22]|uniref:uncharacterized protein n=1 Tax=Fomitiporia mediterranea (strain MF3/22) TaxID=694068 RepID=UPI0004408448|nr:uncharacterized protein FOMMEDRAFT_156407 [Fomitiporia mediterranea MF3/22]EJD03042.1 hypothetical protein FOMMEDRAFT_156407 [Fomitiporia mediterranea MF3/22]